LAEKSPLPVRASRSLAAGIELTALTGSGGFQTADHAFGLKRQRLVFHVAVRSPLTGPHAAGLIWVMRFTCAVALLLGVSSVAGAETEQGKYPLALNPDFQFRKAKIYTLSQNLPRNKAQKGTNPSDQVSKTAYRSRTVTQEASLNFERYYRMFGAVTALDQRQRYGQYFDFFWRAKRPSDVTVRFEYKQEKLRAFVQAKEQAYHNAHGTNRSEFQVIGDEYFDDGQVLAWRCLLIEHGRIVAEKRSFLWD
jgi:hypothetical protein